jgi:hypothetical protein
LEDLLNDGRSSCSHEELLAVHLRNREFREEWERTAVMADLDFTLDDDQVQSAAA